MTASLSRYRVLHIGKYLPPVPGGMETYLGDLLRVLSRTGSEVAALVHAKVGYHTLDPDAFSGVKIFYVWTWGELLFVPIAPLFRSVLQRALREFQPKILHFHMPNVAVFWALTLPEARRLPWVIHWHADVDPSGKNRFLRWAYRLYRPFEQLMLRRSSIVVVTSQSYLAASRALFAYRDRCRVVPLGLDLDRLRAIGSGPSTIATLWRPGSVKKVLAVGRLTYYKGFDLLIKAIALRPECDLLIVGHGPGMATLAALADSLGVSSRVRILSKICDSELAALYKSCDVVCLPSIDRSEAFGMVLLEAAYFGAGIVAADIPGSATGTVALNLGGAVFPVGSVTALASRLAEAERSDKCAVLASRLQLHVESMVAVYREVVQRAGFS
jgi:glycosyltransferase involved in cell wall biosynthesis